MSNHFVKSLSGLALAITSAVVELPVSPRAVQAQAITSAAATKNFTNSSGQIRIVHEETNNPFFAKSVKTNQHYGLFAQASQMINNKINLPSDITVVFRDCGEPNAFYYGFSQEIIMCNELMENSYELLLTEGYSEEEAMKTAIFTSILAFYHEVGHMLIDQLNLPITGKEEDAADQFAAVFLLLNDKEYKFISGEIILAGANRHKLLHTDPDDSLLQSLHSLGKQRFYNLVCLLYGASSEQYGSLLSNFDHLGQRSRQCDREFRTISTSWQRLLEPHLKSVVP